MVEAGVAAVLVALQTQPVNSISLLHVGLLFTQRVAVVEGRLWPLLLLVSFLQLLRHLVFGRGLRRLASRWRMPWGATCPLFLVLKPGMKSESSVSSAGFHSLILVNYMSFVANVQLENTLSNCTVTFETTPQSPKQKLCPFLPRKLH